MKRRPARPTADWRATRRKPAALSVRQAEARVYRDDAARKVGVPDRAKALRAQPVYRSREAAWPVQPATMSVGTGGLTASRIICAKVSWLGNFRMLSTRYWYDARSSATSSPIFGMTAKE